jgi:putative transposase
MGIKEVVIAPRSPWQNAFVGRLVGSIRRECLDHVMMLGARHLRNIVRGYFDYYEHTRTHLSLSKDAPCPQATEPPALGPVVQAPQVGGKLLHSKAPARVAAATQGPVLQGVDTVQSL